MLTTLRLLLAGAALGMPAAAREIHVALSGNDTHEGSAARPLRTISAAARMAMPGDTVTVHEGTYRERVTPPRGGASDNQRIVYQAAPGEMVILKGSEVVRDWKPFAPGVWKATLPNSLFGNYNPYQDRISGDWFTDKGRPHHTGEVYLNGKSLWESHLLERVLNPRPYPGARDPEGSTYTWFAEADGEHTYIYANFHDKDPNKELVEINVRDSCFYPDQPGRNYITVRGFRMSHAATQWAAPTAEQIGLLGTHWSKGWIIEHNVLSDSKCSCLTLGKERATGHNVWINDPSKDGAIHYNEVVVRALRIGWSKENIGSHIVRHNIIHDCEQAGIAGSLGAVFSQLHDNHIYNVWTKRQFTGAEMGGIKLHAAIDVVIRNNRIHGAGRGVWLDWMAQGTRVTGNLLYDNDTDDVFVEVNHGPFLLDHNVMLSPISLRDWSQGGAYVHNLFGGQILSRPELNRSTPYHRAHSTAVVAIRNIPGGDNRFYNNLFYGGASTDPKASWGLAAYDGREFPSFTGGNVYMNGALPYGRENAPLIVAEAVQRPVIEERTDGVYLLFEVPSVLNKPATRPVTSALLGKARVSELGYENADGSPLTLTHDMLGKTRSPSNPSPGPFESLGPGRQALKLR
jgi:hypothetical protein